MEIPRRMIYQEFGASGYYTFVASDKAGLQIRRLTNLQHLSIVGIDVLVFWNVPNSIVLPKPEVAVLPDLFDCHRRHPTPCSPKVVPVPYHEVRECGRHSEVRGKKLDNPCSSIERKSLCSQEGGINFKLVVEDAELVILRPICIK